MNWKVSALLSALFAGMTAILAKIGIENVPTNVAMLVRTCVVVVCAGGLVILRGEGGAFKEITNKSWLFLTLSGIATGLSWLFYFSALKEGKVQQVAPIDKLSFVIAMALAFVFLHEKAKPTTIAGAGLIVCGVLLTLV